MENNPINHQRLVANTLFLYFRMLLIMGVNLFVVRELLRILGTSDYGLYNVIGGVTAMFVFLNNAIASSSQRYISFTISRGSLSDIQNVYSSIVIVYIGVCFLIFVIGESLGLWFVMTQLKYDLIKENTVFWTYQFTLISLITIVFSSNYNAAIISYEKMNVFAYISIFDAIAKLGVIYVLDFFIYDKVRTYAFLILLVNFSSMFLYYIFTRKYCSGCRFCFHVDKKQLKEIVSFSGWNLLGSLSGVLRSNGINILLNVFFGTVINAARGISYQVYGALHNFSNNFYLAVRPQLIKSYSLGEKQETTKLLYISTKASFFLLLLLSFPVFTNTSYLLHLWLRNYPIEAIVFTQLVLANMLLESISNPLMTLAQATGNVKKYQLWVGTLLLLNLPLSFLAYYWGAPVLSCFIIMLFLNVITLFVRLTILKEIADLNLKDYLRSVIWPILCVVILCVMCYYPSEMLNVSGNYHFIISVVTSSLLFSIICYFIGFTYQERLAIIKMIKNILSKII